MTESKVIVDDPDYVRKKTVDGNGRLYVGQEFAEKNVRVVIEVLDEADE